MVPAEEKLHARIIAVGQVLICGVLLFMFTVGIWLDRNPPPLSPAERVWLFACIVVMDVILAGAVISGIGRLLNRSWVERLNHRLIAATLAGVVLVFVVGTVRGAFEHIAAGDLPVRGEAFMLVATLAWAVGGVVAFFRNRQKRGSERLLTSFLWPVILLFTQPIFALLILVILIAFIGGGEWVGARIGHPYAGAFVGLVCLVAAIIGLAKRRRRSLT